MANWAFLSELRNEWPTAKAANCAVLIALTLGSMAGFGAASLWWSTTTTTLRERVAYWQERAQNNPTTRTDRHLTEDQTAKLVSTLKPLAESIQNLIVSVEGVPEAVHYSTEFIKILKDVAVLTPLAPVFAWSEKLQTVLMPNCFGVAAWVAVLGQQGRPCWFQGRMAWISFMGCSQWPVCGRLPAPTPE